MVGLTGGIQGAKGKLFGKDYEAGSWLDQLVEASAVLTTWSVES